MTPLPRFPLDKVEDQYVNETLIKLQDFLRDNSPLLDFKHFELTFDANVADFKFAHNLGYAPKDLLVTYTKNGTIVFDYASFDKTNLLLTVSGVTDDPCVVRFLLGTYNSNP